MIHTERSGWRGPWPALRVMALAGAVLVVAPGAGAQQVATAAAQDTTAVAQDAAAVAQDIQDAAAQALAEASAARRAAYKLEDEAVEAALREVVRRYDTIVEQNAWPIPTRAEAAFRAGEILRARGQVDEAVARFRQATDLGAQGADQGALAFAARGLLERGHLRRRDGDAAGALKLYAEVERGFEGSRRACAHARTWTGKLLLAEGRREEAFSTLLGFQQAFPEYPFEAMRNADLVAVERLEAGDVAGARAIVERLRLDMAPLAERKGPEGEKIRRTLSTLRVTALLEEH